MQTNFELISHHLCPFLHRSVILLERKGLKKDMDFKVTYVPVYDFPKWLFELSPKGNTPILKMEDSSVLLRSLPINAYFDETISPSFLPENAFERAKHRSLILSCGDLLDTMRMVYTTKDKALMDSSIDKIFSLLKDIEYELNLISQKNGMDEVQMVECAFASFFTVLLNFDRIRDDEKWNELKDIRNYADKLITDPTVQNSKCPNYNDEFDKFFNFFGSAFKS
ncbi:MAG: hypothetical protein GC192_04850 [Bacteroidetes bacterium]|nr:hypothetical protein [Bacteroidota bacterium]